ncbi:MAG: hypothetical protein ACHQIO_12385, partial [Nevskiales bacterium]
MLVAGRLLESGSATGSTRSNGFIVSSGSVVRSKSELATFDATTYFTDKAAAAGVAKPELPTDGGYLAFDAVGSSAKVPATPLLLNSTIKLAAAFDGRAGTMDISAPNIEVVANSGQSTGTLSGVPSVQLVAGDLDALGADSLLLGGLRDTSNGSLHLNVRAKTVTLSNDASDPLSAPEIIIAASTSVNMNSGAALQGTGTLARPAADSSLNLPPQAPSLDGSGKTLAPEGSGAKLLLDGGGALLLVSSGSPLSVVRASAAKTGALTIASGATVAASGSANLDASTNVTLNGQLNLAPGSALSLGAPGISLGSAIPAVDSANPQPADSYLKFGTKDLAKLNSLGQLVFNSYAAPIDLYGTVNLGSSALQMLSFKGAGFQAFGTDPTSRQASFVADVVRFDGTSTSVAPASSSQVSGTLAVQANTLEIGDNAFAIRGYADTNLTARSQAVAWGTGGQLVADQNLTLAAARIDTASGADATFAAGGKMILTKVANPLLPSSPAALGGQLSFVADSIAADAQIVAPSGKVALVAPNGVNVTDGLISVAGSAVDFGSTTAYSPGGTITLNGGSVALAAPAVLDLSAVGAAAGVLSIAANNSAGSATVQLNGKLLANATAGVDGVVPTQGQFLLDADQADGKFGTLNAKLNDAGFLESRQFRYRKGDVQLGNGDKLTAHQVVIAADNGNISIGGDATIDASGEKGGSIELYASQPLAKGNDGKVTLKDTGRLVATGSIGDGGRVVIGTASADGSAPTAIGGGGSIKLAGGSIDVAGSDATRNGSVTLRAPRMQVLPTVVAPPAGTATPAAAPPLVGDNDVNIASLKTDIRNSSSTVIEAYKVY